MSQGHRDLFDHARGEVQRKGFEPKFPAAVLLDKDGRKLEPEVLLAPNDAAVEANRHNLGCPCCDARLKWTRAAPEKLGSRGAKSFFSSLHLEDHVDCELASVDEKVRSEAHKRYEFFMQQGPKILYWNLPYAGLSPRFKRETSSPMEHLGGPKYSARQEGDERITLGVKSMKEFVRLARH